jgi:hypothetical protein
MPSDTQWAVIKRLHPITHYFKHNDGQKRQFLNALRSSTGRKANIGKLLHAFINKYGKDSDFIQSYLSKALESGDARAVVISLKDSLFSHHLSKEDKPNTKVDIPKPVLPRQKIVNQRKRKAKGAPTAKDIPTKLGQLNTAIGTLNQTIKNGKIGGVPFRPNQRVYQKQDKDDFFGVKGEDREPEDYQGYGRAREENFGNAYWSDKYKFDKPGKMKGLRSVFEEAKPNDIDKAFPEERKIASNVEFDLFSHVPPGYGNGVDNALFRMDVNRKREIEWMEPMYEHRTWTGPECGISPLPYQWKDDMTPENQRRSVKQMGDIQRHALQAARLPFHTVLPNEGFSKPSSKGLPSRRQTLLEPVINTREPTYNPVTPAGAYLRPPHYKPYDPLQSRYGPPQPSANTLPPVYGYQSTRDLNWMQ